MVEVYNIFIQFLGLISIASMVVTGFLLVKNDPNTDHSSVSSYAGSTRSQARLGFLALIGFSLPLYLWIMFWLIPEYDLPPFLYPFLLLSFIGHVLLVRYPLIPSNGRKHLGNVLHLGAGSVVALSMLGLLAVLCFSSLINELVITKMILFIAVAYMVSCLLGYVFTKNQKYFFEFEVAYILMFAICIGFLTFKI